MAEIPDADRQDAAHLEGAYRSRVFVGGSYHLEMRSRLDDIKLAVREAGFFPVVADEVLLQNQSDIHHETMVLLHGCRLAIFELSRPSGAFMEIERVADYATQTLILFNAPKKSEYTGSRMLSTFVAEHNSSVSMTSYLQPQAARRIIGTWLSRKKKEGFG